MAGIFTKHIWQPCICQPNKLKREIKKKLGAPNGKQSKNMGAMANPGPSLESPLAGVGSNRPSWQAESKNGTRLSLYFGI